MRIKVEGVEQIVKKMGYTKAIEDKVNQAIRKNIAEAEQKAKRYAPVDTGHLKRSIFTELDKQNLEGRVISPVEYSKFLEYGTRYMSAQPYMIPAWKNQMPTFISDMKNIGVWK